MFLAERGGGQMANDFRNIERKITLKIVVVIYNKKFSESCSLVSLLKQNFLNSHFQIEPILYVFDNSKIVKVTNDEISKLNEKYLVNFLHDSRNRPLSEIYSLVFKSANNGEYILLLDDDTNLPSDFILNFGFQSLNLSESDIVFAPKVIVSSKVISPYRSYFVFSRPVNVSTVGINGRLSAINSGVIIRKSDKLDNFVYPKYSTFYGTDTVLFDYFNDRGYKIFVLDVLIEHDLSFHPSSDKDVYLNSLSKVVAFWREHYREDKFRSFLLDFYLLFLSVRVSLRYRELLNLFKYVK